MSTRDANLSHDRLTSLLRRRVLVFLLPVISAVLLLFSFAPYDCWFLAGVAMVPFLLVASRCTGRWLVSLSGWISGVLFWALAVWWLYMPTPLGYVLGTLYLSLYFLLAMVLVRMFASRGQKLWIVFPLVWTCLEYVRSCIIPFDWFCLAQTQYRNIYIIQIADVTGQYGISFLVAMCNGLIVDLVNHKRDRRSLRAVCTTCIIMIIVFGYGFWRISQDTQKPGPVVGLVQPSIPITLGGRANTVDQTLDTHILLTMDLAGKGCDVILWPETILPPCMNQQKKASAGKRLDFQQLAVAYLLIKYISPETFSHINEDSLRSIAGTLIPGSDFAAIDPKQVREAIKTYLRVNGSKLKSKMLAIDTIETLGQFRAEVLAACSRFVGCPILAGGVTRHKNARPVGEDDIYVYSNSVLYFDSNGISSDVYSKQHLVPFSEYVPLKYSWLSAHRFLRSFVPEQMPQLEPGPAPHVFSIPTDDGLVGVVTPVCYEGTFADVCREMVQAAGDNAVIANVSNDGWFVWPAGDSFDDTTEQYQHLVHYVFRAVELRTPVVRAVNTGISGVIDSNGRIVCVVTSSKEDGHKMTMIEGTASYPVLVDSRSSAYSVTGDWFAIMVSMIVLVLIVITIVRHRNENSGRKNTDARECSD